MINRIIPYITDDGEKKIFKDMNTYLNSFAKKESLKRCYDVALGSGKATVDLKKAFKSKDFWKNYEDCGSWLEFRHYNQLDVTKLHTANFCKRDKLCAPCAIRRAYKQQQKFMQILEVEEDLKDLDWFYIVIPVVHNKDEDFLTVFARLEKVRLKITKSMRNSRSGIGNNFWSQFKGGMYSTETTKSKNGWNVHLNLIINAPKGTKIALNGYKQAKPLEDWLKKNAEGSYVHNIDKLDTSSDEKMKEALVEVLKYSLKFSSLDNYDLLNIFIDTYRKRLFGTFGNMRGHNIENVSLEGDIKIDEEFVEFIFMRAGLKYECYSVTAIKGVKIKSLGFDDELLNANLKYNSIYL